MCITVFLECCYVRSVEWLHPFRFGSEKLLNNSMCVLVSALSLEIVFVLVLDIVSDQHGSCSAALPVL